MPQLDKYTFFNQITYTTFFFGLIYTYVRGKIIPKISSLLKYRKKKEQYMNTEINNYLTLITSLKTYIDKKTKTFLIFLLEKLNILNVFYQKETVKKFYGLNNVILASISKIGIIINFFIKNKKESDRLTSLSNDFNNYTN
jgi:hypothetical protein